MAAICNFTDFFVTLFRNESIFDTLILNTLLMYKDIQQNWLQAIIFLPIFFGVNTIDIQNLSVLHVAARHGKSDTLLRVLLNDKRVINYLESSMYNGDTPLLVAARHGNVQAAKVFIDYGANIQSQKMETGNTVLHFAARFEDTDLMNLFLSKNLSPDFLNTTNMNGETALEIGIKEKSHTVEVLLQAGADYYHPNPFTGRNVLHTSVAFNQCETVQELLSRGSSQKHTDLADNRGDTPLMLAIRIRCFDCVKVLMNHITQGKEINKRTKESILHITVDNNEEDVLKYILMFCREDVIGYKDTNGMTPLLFAIERKKDNCLETLMKTQNIFLTNGRTGETALHAAIRVQNHIALDMLLSQDNAATGWNFVQKDRNDRTPFWLAVERGDAAFIVESRKKGWVDIDELNNYGDSPTFVAAACGHLQVLKALLLSERYYEFCRQHERDPDLKNCTLIKNAEICCDIYNSDIYILTNKTKKNKLNTWVPKSLMTINKRTGQNIFHACALGGNVSCLTFIHNFFKSFQYNLDRFDYPDSNGNTPLLLATRNEGPECVYYFLSNGANISSRNKDGEGVLKSLLVNTEHSVDLLMSVLNDGIIYDVSARGLQEECESIRVTFSLLRPPNEPVTKIVKLFYESIEGYHRNKLLQHMLFKTYVKIVLASVNYFFLLRFIISLSFTTILTIYLIFYAMLDKGKQSHLVIITSFKLILGVLSGLGLLCSLPLILHGDLNYFGLTTQSLMVLPGVLVLYLIFIPYGSSLAFEIAALAVLVSWLSLLMYSTTIFKDISHQVSMLSHVIQGMIVYFRIVFLIILPFSLSFYCIFNDNYYFGNPIKSFIYTSFILLQGDTIDSFDYFENKHWTKYVKDNSVEKNTTSHIHVGSTVDQLDLWLESIFLSCFIVMCVLGLLNMLVGLAVRDGKTLAADGDIFRRRLQIHWLNSLEKFLESFTFKIIRRTPLIYLLGIIPTLTLTDFGKNHSSKSEKKTPISLQLNSSITDFKKYAENNLQIRESQAETDKQAKLLIPARPKSRIRTTDSGYSYTQRGTIWH